jgi:hypothetical protein
MQLLAHLRHRNKPATLAKVVVQAQFKVQNLQKQIVGSCENAIYIQAARLEP